MDAKTEYLEIEGALRSIADRVKVLSDNTCLGIVVQSYSEHTGEVILSLNLITPKLKDYSYRLIELKSQSYIDRFPIDARLFAKHPRNHQLQKCENMTSLKDTLEFFITHSFTKMILNHLAALGALADEYHNEPIEILLKKDDAKKSFEVNNSNRPIRIKKIVLTSHFQSKPNEWLEVILGSQIKFTCSGFSDGAQISYPMSLISNVTPMTIVPVFDVNFIFPSVSDLRMHSPNAIAHLKYELELITNSSEAIFSIWIEKDSLVLK